VSAPRRGKPESLAIRAQVVNWLLSFAEIVDLPPIPNDADMGALERARYERRLDLLPGSLSIGRFERDFPELSVPQIGAQLLDEAYVGAIQRIPVQIEQGDSTEETPVADDLSSRFERILAEIGLSAGEVIMLTGSPDVGLTFSAWGVYVPELRRQPGHTDFRRFGLAIVGRGQAGHKVFEPWTQLIRSYEKHLGPTLVTSPSSNVSGLLDFLWNQRTSIGRYVEIWRESTR
jgi:hypothetical protein